MAVACMVVSAFRADCELPRPALSDSKMRSTAWRFKGRLQSLEFGIAKSLNLSRLTGILRSLDYSTLGRDPAQCLKTELAIALVTLLPICAAHTSRSRHGSSQLILRAELQRERCPAAAVSVLGLAVDPTAHCVNADLVSPEPWVTES